MSLNGVWLVGRYIRSETARGNRCLSVWSDVQESLYRPKSAARAAIMPTRVCFLEWQV